MDHDAWDASLIEAIDNEVQIITLVTGKREDGEDYYAYALIPPSRYQPFLEAQAAGAYDLADYGRIVAHGKGVLPPAEVQEHMRRTYGANHRFEEELRAIQDDMDL